MANGGAVGGVKLLGEKGWKALHAHPTHGGLGVGQGVFHFTQGGVAEFRAEDGHAERQGFYGWLGYGGSVFQWHPRLRIGFAYVPTVLEFHCMYNRKAGRMQVKLKFTYSGFEFTHRRKLFTVQKTWRLQRENRCIK